MTETEMLQEIHTLKNRVTAIETSQAAHMLQTNSIKSDTTELLNTFNALKGAWTVLNAIGKLAKPLTFIAGCFAAFYAIKNGLPK